jgi:hypothetical protein
MRRCDQVPNGVYSMSDFGGFYGNLEGIRKIPFWPQYIGGNI